MKDDFETTVLKTHFPQGNYFFTKEIEAYPYVGNDNEFSVNTKIIPKRSAFLILDLWAGGNPKTKRIIFKILWNCNQHVISVDYSFLKNMYFLTENGVLSLEEIC